MNDIDFYQQILGLEEPWRVEGVELDMAASRVVVRLGVKAGTKWAEEGRLLPIHGYEVMIRPQKTRQG